MARSQSQSSQREDGEATGGVVRRQSPRKSVTGGSAPVLSGGYLQRHTSKVRICFVLEFGGAGRHELLNDDHYICGLEVPQFG